MKFLIKSVLPVIFIGSILAAAYFGYAGNIKFCIFSFSIAFLTALTIGLRLIHSIKKLSIHVQAGKKMGYAGIITSAANTIIEKNKTIDDLILGVTEIQNGNLTVMEMLQLKGRERDAITNLQTGLVKMKADEQHQNWAVRGIAQISEVRKTSSDLTSYSQNILNTLIKYLKANQGFFYLYSKERDVVELLATYAFEKEKIASGKISVHKGDGLVGQCLQDKELLVLTDVPSGYVNISSGLGSARPRCITIFPLIFREEAYGVIELASFRKFEMHQIEFIKRVSESIASEIAGSLQQELNARLLQQSQQDADELKLQEVKSKQSMEIMAATQEEMKRKEALLLQNMKELKEIQDRLQDQESELKQQLMQVLVERRKNQAILEGCVDGVISFGENFKVQFVNSAAVGIFGFRRSELLAKPLEKILDVEIIKTPGHTGEPVLVNSNGDPIQLRTPSAGKHKNGEELSLLITATKVKLDNESLFTLFVQDKRAAQIQS